VAFRRDSYLVSFGSDQRFVEAPGGIDGYLGYLRDRISHFPNGHVHVWQGETIIGQLEMRIRDNDPPSGYVNLFYLAPAARGTGAGNALHDYALQFLRAGGAQRAHLSVSPSNSRALAYYAKHGWRELGLAPHDPTCLMMELDLPALAP